MGTRLKPEQLKIYKQIDSILYHDWNPIGIDELPRDEYQSYLPHVFSLKIHGAGIKEIGSYLYQIETQNIGVTGYMPKCEKVAKLIYEL